MEPNKFFLRGEIDMANADALVATLHNAAGRQDGELVVDCMDITFIDAAGIRALILVHCELAQQGRDLRLVHPSRLLTRMLEILDLPDLLGPPRNRHGRATQTA